MPSSTSKALKNQNIPAIKSPLSVAKEELKNNPTNAARNGSVKLSAATVEGIAINFTEQSGSNSNSPVVHSSLKQASIPGEDPKEKSSSSSRSGSLLLASKLGSNRNLKSRSVSYPKLPIINSSLKGAYITGRPKEKEIIKETIIPKTTSPTLKLPQKKKLPAVISPVLSAPVSNDIETIDVIEISTDKIDRIEPTALVEIVQVSIPVEVKLVAPVKKKKIVPIIPPRTIKRDGNVTFVYENYHESFPIMNGSTTDKNIDEVYCLSFIMPGVLIHVSIHDANERRELEAKGSIDVFCPEKPLGTYQDLEANTIYYVYIEQQRDQLARDIERMKRVAHGMIGELHEQMNKCIRNNYKRNTSDLIRHIVRL
jgi:hypothetical protein